LELRRKVTTHGQQPGRVLALVVDGVHECFRGPGEDVCRPRGADMHRLWNDVFQVEIISGGFVRFFFDFRPNQIVHDAYGVHGPAEQRDGGWGTGCRLDIRMVDANGCGYGVGKVETAVHSSVDRPPFEWLDDGSIPGGGRDMEHFCEMLRNRMAGSLLRDDSADDDDVILLGEYSNSSPFPGNCCSCESTSATPHRRPGR